ncbi:Glycoside hydrolase superfamily [Naviculisporaceae sp. PSN 640]
MAEVTSARYAAFLTEDHPNIPTDKTYLEGITHVILAFASSSLFLSQSSDSYSPFLDVSNLRANVDPGTKICLAIGGWGDTAGFGAGCANDSSRTVFATKVAQTLNKTGFDCVDIHWDFPGGNGEDYKTVPNSAKVSEIQNFPLLLKEIKAAIGPKEFSIAVPGRKENMIAYTEDTAPILNSTVDHIHVMTYDLMNRRDNSTKHQHSVVGVYDAINLYSGIGFSRQKLSLGFAFYAGWFRLRDGKTCVTPTGCPTLQLELPDGSDWYRSGSVAFEPSSYYPGVPSNLTVSNNGTCGSGTYLKCKPTHCCSQHNSCGKGQDYCGVGCQNGYGKRCYKTGHESGDAPTILEDFNTAMNDPQFDFDQYGRYYIDHVENLFWSWDEPEDIKKKYDAVYKVLDLGGVFIWSLGQDSYSWARLKQVRDSYLGDHPRLEMPQGYPKV